MEIGAYCCFFPDKEEPGNYGGITLLSVVGKMFLYKILNRLVEC